MTKRALMAVAMTVALFVAAGCGSDSSSSSGSGGAAGRGGPGPRAAEGADADDVGKGEGKLNIIAWAGYAEDGSNDPKVDWVTPFEKADGLPGQRQDRQHLRRDGHADAHRPVRRRLGVG